MPMTIRPMPVHGKTSTRAQGASPEDVFNVARGMYMCGEKLDMTELSRRVGIARATLYRWIGDRDRLIVDILWHSMDTLFAFLAHTAPTTGPALGQRRIQHLMNGVLEAIVGSVAYRAFLDHEGKEGLNLITSPQGLHGRVVERLIDLAQTEVDAGNYTPPADLTILIESAVSLVEHFLYAHFVVEGFKPKLEHAKVAVGLLLRESV
ncbi:MAG: QsdR family transcriptional regulator [Limnobacter sp.]|uniref:QsdR family transcriptional regulator n=1 Tax=Limnobacter sp. TaxID=2003368 RepID=UPI00391D8A9F